MMAAGPAEGFLREFSFEEIRQYGSNQKRETEPETAANRYCNDIHPRSTPASVAECGRGAEGREHMIYTLRERWSQDAQVTMWNGSSLTMV
jgi:hypothetical protein